jgi:hypothetical protein
VPQDNKTIGWFAKDRVTSTLEVKSVNTDRAGLSYKKKKARPFGALTLFFGPQERPTLWPVHFRFV